VAQEVQMVQLRLEFYGQAGSFNSGIANNGGISADSLWAPFGFAIDSTGRVYIADSGNNRVLFY